MPDHHDDLRRDSGAAERRAAYPRLAADAVFAWHDPRDLPFAQKGRRHDRHGHDREAGRLGCARQHHAGSAPIGNNEYLVTGHNGFFRRRCAMRIWCWRKRQTACRAFSCRAGGRMAARTDADPAPEEKVGNRSNSSSESSSAMPGASCSAKRAEACRPSSKWPPTPASIAVSAPVAACARPLSGRLHHASHRSAFGARLIEQPLMRNVLADLALETEAATALSLRMARAFDSLDNEAENAFRRLATPPPNTGSANAARNWRPRRWRCRAATAMVDEGMLARIYREMPVNLIWKFWATSCGLDLLRWSGSGADSGAGHGVAAAATSSSCGNARLKWAERYRGRR